METKESFAISMPSLKETETHLVPEAKLGSVFFIEDKTKCSDPLINVIQKLTTMVESEKSSSLMEGKKRPYPDDTMLSEDIHKNCASPAKTANILDIHAKRSKEEVPIDLSDTDSILQSDRKVMFYQCGLCKFISSSFEALKVHVKNHGQQNEIILMCSECHLTFKNHDELEVHVKKHCENTATVSQFKDHAQEYKHSSALPPNIPEPERKKWYAYEAYGLYRCLICRYTCGQQRMLKTHAWKHAGEVDCSYPIFEEENESAGLPDSTVAHTPQGSESVLSEDVQSKQQLQIPRSDQVKVCDSLPLEEAIKETKVLSTTGAMTEVVVVEEEALSDTDQDNNLSDSLLSSAQKIISCSQNKKGHVNVIVERLPSAEEGVSPKTFLSENEMDVKENQLICGSSVEVYHADKNAIENEEIIIGWSSSVKNTDFQEAENSPPVRRRTNSECLRLHSLAAEALVTMPIRVVECPKASLRIINGPNPIDPDTGQREESDANYPCPKIVSSKIKEEFNSLNQNSASQKEIKDENELTEAPIRMGISMSLLKVIEKLRERTDQNATDDDILKELRDNAQTESTTDLGSGSNLVEYLPDAERPYRCRLCHYTSDNKGYIKQHLRVHRQRQPYQCPICEHIADNSSGLENHMINHCKTRMYECKHCAEAFYYKSQLRNHEREHRSLPDNCTLSTSSEEPQICNDDVEEKHCPEGSKTCTPKQYQCDVCSYTSSTYVGVRNHRRIHTSDKPYRCSLCGYVCSHPPSLKSHMWKHASDQNYNYEQVNKAINEAMSQSSRVQVETLTKNMVEDSDAVTNCDGGNSALLPTKEVTSYIETPKINPAPVTLCNTGKLQNQIRPETELCVLLFCCCICGFESTNKELLMEHMKAHEGEIINIILNKSESTS